MKLLKYPSGALVQVRDEDVPEQVQRIKRDHNITVTVADAPPVPVAPEPARPAKKGK